MYERKEAPTQTVTQMCMLISRTISRALAALSLQGEATGTSQQH